MPRVGYNTRFKKTAAQLGNEVKKEGLINITNLSNNIYHHQIVKYILANRKSNEWYRINA